MVRFFHVFLKVKPTGFANESVRVGKKRRGGKNDAKVLAHNNWKDSYH